MSEKSVILWNVHFDQDKFSYTYNNFEKLIQAVDTFADLQISDGIANKDEAIEKVSSNVREHLQLDEAEGMYVIMIGDAQVQIKKIILDEQNPVVKALIAAYPQVNKKTKKSIDLLVSEPLSS